MMGNADFAQRLDAAVERAWQSADDVRLPLQQAAERQVAASLSAYTQVRNLLESRETRSARPRAIDLAGDAS